MSSKDILKLMKDKEIEFVDFRFTDPKGKLQHLTMDATIVDDQMLEEGVFFDGSSIAGWKVINESDMILKPDLERPIVDPFNSHNTINIFCDILDAVKKEPYERDPRGTAKKAEAYLKKLGVGDKAYFGPEPEFFTFEDVRFENKMNTSNFFIDSSEGPYNSGKKYENGNMGHRPGVKGGYFPVPPVDSAQDMRAEMLKALKDMGVKVEKHHHEVAPSQHELGMYFGTLTDMADNVQLYKYAVHMVSHSFGKTSTFMPKPIKGDNGSGMHVHQSIWKGNTPVFMGDKYAGLSQQALYYIGGILKHAKAINAFTNSTTNSYISLMLDTQTGKSWMVQIGIGEGVAAKAVLNDFEYAYTVESAKEKYQQALKAWEENDDLDKEAWKPKKDFYKDMIGVVGQFKLYPTKNMFNFIMVNVIDGTTWQVQWSVDEDKRIINLIW